MPTLQDLTHGRLSIDEAVLDEFCRQWKIAKLELFGAALRDDFNAESDIDLLVSFLPDANWGLFEHERAERELSELAGQKVELVTRRAIEANPNEATRRGILGNAVSVYEAR
jgi:predicted nucleotidyltransferase